MKIEIVTSSQGGMSSGQQVQIEHDGRKALLWDVSAYSRSRERSDASNDLLFSEINRYFSQISTERQYRLYQLYEALREDLSTGYSMNSLKKTLQARITTLYQLIPFDDIETWVRRDSDIRIPSTFKVVHGPDDLIDQTYTRQDYQQLVALAVALRAMVPIWGEFVKASRDYAGNLHKELEGLRLLYYSDLSESPPMKRLLAYIEATAGSQQKTGPSLATLMGEGAIGSSEMPDYLLAITVVRRLAVCAISGIDDSINMITNIHQFITHNLRGMDRKIGGNRFGGSITDKEKSASQKEESNDSLMELYKIKQATPDGEGVKTNVFTEYLDSMVNHVDPTIPPAYVTACLAAVRSISQRPVLDHQRVLVQYVMNKPIPAQGVPRINLEGMLVAMPVVQAALWHWGLYSLAVLVTATPVTLNDGIILGGNDLRGRMPKEQSDTLARLFKHYRQPRMQNAAAKTYNVAARAIESYSTLVARSNWDLHAPPELLQLATTIENYRCYEVTAEIRMALYNLVLRTAL